MRIWCNETLNNLLLLYIILLINCNNNNNYNNNKDLERYIYCLNLKYYKSI